MKPTLTVCAFPLLHSLVDVSGSDLSWNGRSSGRHRSSRRLTAKASVNYSERALELNSLGASATEQWELARPPSDDDDDDDVSWTELEKERFADAYVSFRKNFRKIALLLKTKTIGQCKRYFMANQRSLEELARKSGVPAIGVMSNNSNRRPRSPKRKVALVVVSFPLPQAKP